MFECAGHAIDLRRSRPDLARDIPPPGGCVRNLTDNGSCIGEAKGASLFSSSSV